MKLAWLGALIATACSSKPRARPELAGTPEVATPALPVVTAPADGDPDLDAIAPSASAAEPWTVVALAPDGVRADAVLRADRYAALAPIVDAIEDLRGKRLELVVEGPDGATRDERYALTAVPMGSYPSAELKLDSVDVIAHPYGQRERMAWAAIPWHLGDLVSVGTLGSPPGAPVSFEVAWDARVEHLATLLEAAEAAGLPRLELRVRHVGGGYGSGRYSRIEIGIEVDDRHDVRREIQGMRLQLEACYDARRGEREDFTAAFAARLAIPAGGGQADVAIDSGDPAMASCVRRVLEAARFRGAAGTVPVRLTFRMPVYD